MMKRIDFETAVLLSEAIPDFWCDVLWLVNKSGDIFAADLKDWYTKYEDKGYAKYPMPYTEQIVEALRDEHLVFLWLEPNFSDLRDITPTWRVFARHHGRERIIAEDTEADTALEKAVVITLQNIKNSKK